jgi:aminotransferase
MSNSLLKERISNKISSVDKTERQELLALAEEKTNLIKLGRGDPDLDTPKPIRDAAKKALDEGYTHYTHWRGMKELREEISKKLKEDNGLDYDPEDEIVVSTGVQESMYVVFQSLLEPGDEVLIADPHYTSYDAVVEFAGGKIKLVPTTEENDFALQPDVLREYISPKTKVMVVVTPNNPTGAVIPPSTLKELASIAKEEDLLVISDEIYEKVIYDDYEHVSMASFPGMYERTIVFNGFSKAYCMTGWRIGYMAAPSDFIDKIERLKHTLTISTNQVSQKAAIAALKGGDELIDKTVETYKERRDYLMNALDEMGLTYGYPAGAMYIFANIRPTGRSAFEFCKDLLLDAGVQIFPGTTYGEGEGYVRISLLAPTDQLKRAADKMTEAVKGYIDGK